MILRSLPSLVRRGLSWFRISRLANRFLLVMIALAFVPVLVVGTVSFRISSRTIEENHIASYSSNLSAFSRTIDLVLQNAVRDSRQILAHPATQSELLPELQGRRVEQRFPVTAVRALDQISRSITVANKHVDSISIFDLGGLEYSYSRAAVSGVSSDRRKVEDFAHEWWYQAAVAAGGREIFVGHNVLADENEDDVISCVKLLRSITDFRTIGLLVITIPKAFLDAHLPRSKANRDVGEYLILHVRGMDVETIYSSRGATPYQHELTSALASYDGITTPVVRIGRSLAMLQVNETTSWDVAHLVAIDLLLADAGRIRSWTVFVSGVTLFVVAVLFVLVSRMLSRPLNKLERVIADVAGGRRTITEEFGDDEIGQIGNQFKALVNTNIDLRERLITANLRQREAELSALQAQINPHFLYNTLDSIFWMAKSCGAEKIAELTLSLSSVFRMSLNDGKDLTIVRRELEHIRHYLAIQNHRYRGRFSVSVSVDERIMDSPILNLSLQPFVENAVRHGLEPKVGAGRLEITGRQIGDTLVFVITDDGVGLPDDAEDADGFAIRNVRERIRLHHGAPFGVELSRRATGGTRVRVVVPCLAQPAPVETA